MNQADPKDDRRSQSGQGEGLHISPSRLATYWNVHPNTVYRDIRKGALRAFRLPGGQLRIRISDARRYGRPVD
jgi:excisionase family DNA binding protein